MDLDAQLIVADTCHCRADVSYNPAGRESTVSWRKVRKFLQKQGYIVSDGDVKGESRKEEGKRGSEDEGEVGVGAGDRGGDPQPCWLR